MSSRRSSEDVPSGTVVERVSASLAASIVAGTPMGAVPEGAYFVHFTELPRKIQNVLNGVEGHVEGWDDASVAEDAEGVLYVVLNTRIGQSSSKNLLLQLQSLGPYSVFLKKSIGYYVYEIH